MGKLNLTIQNGKVIKDEYELVEISASKLKLSKDMAALISSNEKPFQEDIYTDIWQPTLLFLRHRQ